MAPRLMNLTSEKGFEENPNDGGWLIVTGSLRIPKSEFRFTFARSSGPGGQNVNKVSTKARLRWPVVDSSSLAEEIKQRFLTRYRRRLTSDGDLLLTSQRYRDQSRNVADCLGKLREMLLEVVEPPKPRKKTKLSRGAKERRLEQKRQQSQKKQFRRPPPQDE